MGYNPTGLTGVAYSGLFERVPVTKDTEHSILTAGLDNLYYQRGDQLRLASPLVKSSTELLEDFLNGIGWSTNGDKVVNRFGETITDILNMVAKDASKYSGAFSLHMNFNGSGTVIEIQWVPFEYVRMHIPKRRDGRITHVAVSNNWERSDNKPKLKPISYPILNPLTAAEETIRGGKGQILYFTGQINGLYPLLSFDSILNTAITDNAIQKYEKNNVTNGFHGASVIHYPGAINTKIEKEKVKKQFKDLLGVEGPGALVVTVDAETDKPIVETVDGLDTDEIFSATLLSVRDRVLQVYKQPPALMGISPQGGVFTQLAYFESYTVYNVVTRNKRNAISRAVGKLTDLMGFKVGDIVENEIGVVPNFGEPNAIV